MEGKVVQRSAAGWSVMLRKSVPGKHVVEVGAMRRSEVELRCSEPAQTGLSRRKNKKKKKDIENVEDEEDAW